MILVPTINVVSLLVAVGRIELIGFVVDGGGVGELLVAVEILDTEMRVSVAVGSLEVTTAVEDPDTLVGVSETGIEVSLVGRAVPLEVKAVVAPVPLEVEAVATPVPLVVEAVATPVPLEVKAVVTPVPVEDNDAVGLEEDGVTPVPDGADEGGKTPELELGSVLGSDMVGAVVGSEAGTEKEVPEVGIGVIDRSVPVGIIVGTVPVGIVVGAVPVGSDRMLETSDTRLEIMLDRSGTDRDGLDEGNTALVGSLVGDGVTVGAVGSEADSVLSEAVVGNTPVGNGFVGSKMEVT